MTDDHNESLAKELKRNITEIDTKLEELQSSITQVGRNEDEALDELWYYKKDAERIFECWSGSRAEKYIELIIDDCNDCAKKTYYTSDEMRDEIRHELNLLNYQREDMQMDMDRINRR